MQVLWKLPVVRVLVLAVMMATTLMFCGCGGSSSSSSGSNVTATPTFNPGAGNYTTAQTVTISDTTSGAVLYCTTDGTTPTTSSPKCSQPTTVYQTKFLQAIAVAPGKSASTVASAGYVVNLNAVPTPTFNPTGGTYNGAQQVTISDAQQGANIYYTLDGSTPTANSTLSSGPVTISQSSTLSAIAVANGYANSGVASAVYTIQAALPMPTIGGISPASGPTAGGTQVTISGANFTGAIVVYFGGTAATSFKVNTDGSITAVSPAGTGTVDVKVVTPSGANATTAADQFTYIPAPTVTGVSPSTGPAAGGTTVNIIGTNFTGATAVDFENVAATNVVVNNDKSITAVSPAGTGSVDVRVSTASGTSAISSSDQFIYTAANVPTINSFNPPSGAAPGAAVTIIGSGFGVAAGSVTFGNATAAVATGDWTDASVKTTVPSSLSAGDTTVTVTTSNNQKATAAFTVTAALPTISGIVVSGPNGTGNSPVLLTTATVELWSVGSEDYGKGAQLIDTVTSDATSGTFSIPYGCTDSKVQSPNDLLYIVATGTNTDVVLMTVLGSCGSLQSATSYTINEATTIASVYALQEFMAPDGTIGAAGNDISYKGLGNAFKTVNNLVNPTTGIVREYTPDYSQSLAEDHNILNNSTVPKARINTLADVLASCVGASGNCSDLRSATGGSANTLAAALYIAQHPGGWNADSGSTTGGLYGLVANPAPYTPTLSAEPNDWTLAVTFTGGGLGFAPGAQIPFADSSTTPPGGKFLHTSMAIDSTGNIWVTAFHYLNSSRSDALSGMIAGFNNLGKPLTGPSSSSTFGGYIAISGANGNGSPNGGTVDPQSIAVDATGNLWVLGGSSSNGGGSTGTPSGGALSEVSYSGSSFSVPLPYAASGQNPASVVIDGSGYAWIQTDAGLEKVDNNGNVQLGPDAGQSSGSPYSYTALQSLIFDSDGNGLWSSDSSYGDLYLTNPSTDTAIYDYFQNPPQGYYTPLAAGSGGNIYGCASDTQSLSILNRSSSASPVNTFPVLTTRGCGVQMVLDGAGHIFTVTGSTGSTVTPGILDEFNVSSSGITMISPTATGYTGTGTGEFPIINPDPNAPVPTDHWVTPGVSSNSVTGAAIDGSGNLWILNEDTGATSLPGNVLVEFVGLAAPVVTPTSAALNFGQVGVRP